MAQTAGPGVRLLQLALEHGALQFGDFTLKSGRPSPYFVNFGKLHTGSAAAQLGRLFAVHLLKLAQEGTLLGIPYKGISLAALACAFAAEQDRACGWRYAYLRKERKSHGEGGWLVGDELRDQVVMIDDVLTAATAVTQTVELLGKQDIRPRLLLVGFDRGERMTDDAPLTAAAQLHNNGIEVASLAGVDDLLQVADAKQAEAISAHLRRYGGKTS